MKIWLLNVSVTILVTTVTSLVLSKGRTAIFVRCMFSILTLLVLIKPFASIKTDDINIKNFIFQEVQDNQLRISSSYLYLHNRHQCR